MCYCPSRYVANCYSIYTSTAYCCVWPLGWNDEASNGQLSIFQVQSFEHGPEVMLSVMIKENFSWAVSYHKQLINPECSNILKSIPSELNSGMYNNKINVIAKWILSYFHI